MQRVRGDIVRGSTAVLLFLALGLLLAGCGSVATVVRADPTAPPAAPEVTAGPGAEVEPVVAPVADTAPAPEEEATAADPPSPADITAADATTPSMPLVIAQAPSQKPSGPPEEPEVEEYDPWEPFNEKMFDFNLNLDKYILKPVARAYRIVLPEPIQIVVHNAFENLRFPVRFVNSVLQGKFDGAGREVLRLVLNSTMGIGGLFDPAKDYIGIKPSNEDFGQTLGVWGSGPGPYLVLPILGPFTVRDGIGYGVDRVTDPLSWFLLGWWEPLALTAGDKVNERALNYDLFEGVQETTLDLYSSVRNFYLTRRRLLIKE